MSTPPGAAVFADRLPLAERLAAWLTGAGIARGLIGPHEADQIWERHLLDAVAITELIPTDSVVVDLGAGAGLPGLPLLLARPDLQLVLIEPKSRRVTFLAEVCADLGLAARVVRARATPAGLIPLPEGRTEDAVPLADIVTARAVAPIADLARWSAPLLREGGRLLAIKGSSAAEELDRVRTVLDRLGMTDVRVQRVRSVVETGPGEGPPPTTVITMTRGRVSRET